MVPKLAPHLPASRQIKGEGNMKEHPIIFTAPMVCALLSGAKTQTRRILKPMRGMTIADCTVDCGSPSGGVGTVWELPVEKLVIPYSTGDILWVKESLGRRPASFLGIETANGAESVFYIATPDSEVVDENEFNLCPWWQGRSLSSCFMPRYASRITLEVTEVRVERLQDISDADAIAEGIIWQGPTDDDRKWAQDYAKENGGRADVSGVWIASGTKQGFGSTKEMRERPLFGPSPSSAYRWLWDSLNAKRGSSWESNPWVSVTTFERVGS
jgi:hypothetical protein